MNYTNLGTSGLRVSRVCLGMMGFGSGSDRPWVIDEDAAEPIVKAAVEGGVTFFDTADTYSAGASEVATGKLVPAPEHGLRRPLPNSPLGPPHAH
jgi:aryl-alcohol dehydrogenase-like predicted oxidoreductase